MRKQIFQLIYAIIFLAIPGSVLATYDKLPETMVGQTTAIQNNLNYYGGFTGNEAVMNYTNNTGQTMVTDKPQAPSLRFDGTNDFVEVTNSSSLNLTSLTISAWVNLTNPFGATHRVIISKEDTPGGGHINRDYNFYLASDVAGNIKANYLHFSSHITNRLGQSSIYFPNDGTLEPSTWYQVAVSATCVDSSNALHKYYLNGRLIGSAVASVAGACGIANNNYPIRIGEPGSVTTMMKGGLDDVQIFNTVKSDSEIENIYNGDIVSAGKVAHWNFNEGSGTLASDSTNNNNDGTLKNFDRTPTSGWDALNGPATADGYNYTGYDNLGFDKSFLADCVNGILLSSAYRCYVSNSTGTAIKTMTSRTYVNTDANKRAVLELSALYYNKSPIVTGDVYLGSGSLDDLEYWGRNLAQGTSILDKSFWSISGSPSENSQSSMAGSIFTAFKAKINQLKLEAKTLSSNPSGTAYLQSSNIALPPNGTTIFDDSNKYPEGKIWYKNSNTTLGNIIYDGKGTIIVEGNLSLSGYIKPADNESRLGIIVIGGTVTIAGNSTVRASILSVKNGAAGGGITFGGNNTSIIGSLVAEGTVTMTNRVNLRVTYDRLLDSYWPPGFRTLNIPKLFENY